MLWVERGASEWPEGTGGKKPFSGVLVATGPDHAWPCICLFCLMRMLMHIPNVGTQGIWKCAACIKHLSLHGDMVSFIRHHSFSLKPVDKSGVVLQNENGYLPRALGISSMLT